MLQDDANTKRLDAGLLGGPGQRDRRVEVDLVGQLRVDVAERVVGERGQVDDRVVAAQVRPASRHARRGEGSECRRPG